jgi:prolyl-tRNA synthetase
LSKIHTPNTKPSQALVDLLNISVEKTVKSIVVEGEEEGSLVLLLLRGDHEFNDIKAEKLAGVKSPLAMATPLPSKMRLARMAALWALSASKARFMPITRWKKVLSDTVVGANEDDYHYTGFNFGRDAAEPEFVDLRNVINGDASPDGQGELKLVRGIEVGHVFQLRTKYAEAMNATVLDKTAKRK